MTKGTNDSEEIKKNVHDSKMKYQFHCYISYIAVQLDSVDIKIILLCMISRGSSTYGPRHNFGSREYLKRVVIKFKNHKKRDEKTVRMIYIRGETCSRQKYA